MIDQLRDEITNHPSNTELLNKGYGPIFSASRESRVVIIGQAPGRAAQETGIPWNDASGKTLRGWLGVTDEQFYDESLFALVPMDFYFPGKGPSGDLPPRKEFAEMWHPKLLEEMPNVELTLLIGQYAQKYYLGDTAERNLTETVRSYEKYLPDYLPLVHPSPLTSRWRSKNPWFATDVLPELQSRVRALI